MSAPPIDALVFDVLGTLVDQPGGIRAGIAELDDAPDDARIDQLHALWTDHVDREQRRATDGDREYLTGDAFDREAAELITESVGATNEASTRLAEVGRRLPPWPDSVAGLARLGERFPVIALSHASRPTLAALAEHTGMRWHQALSADRVRRYKPDPAVYRLAVTASGFPPERLLMVAAHAWDLRGAQAIGMRTAYVARPVGDPPSETDEFDLCADGLDDLAARL